MRRLLHRGGRTSWEWRVAKCRLRSGIGKKKALKGSRIKVVDAGTVLPFLKTPTEIPIRGVGDDLCRRQRADGKTGWEQRDRWLTAHSIELIEAEMNEVPQGHQGRPR